MRDRIGNVISKGSLVSWTPPAEVLRTGMVMVCIDVSDGGIETPQGQSPAFVSLRVDIPINKTGRGEPALPDMLVAMNPIQQAALEKLMEGVKQ